MNKLTIRTLAAWAIAAFVLAIVPLAGAATARTTSARAVMINVQAGEFFFRLSQKSIAKPGAVTFAVTNVGHVLHDFEINGKTTPLLQPGKGSRLTVLFTKRSRYSYLCTIPGHAAAGMKGVFTVR